MLQTLISSFHEIPVVLWLRQPDSISKELRSLALSQPTPVRQGRTLKLKCFKFRCESNSHKFSGKNLLKCLLNKGTYGHLGLKVQTVLLPLVAASPWTVHWSTWGVSTSAFPLLPCWGRICGRGLLKGSEWGQEGEQSFFKTELVNYYCSCLGTHLLRTSVWAWPSSIEQWLPFDQGLFWIQVLTLFMSLWHMGILN